MLPISFDGNGGWFPRLEASLPDMYEVLVPESISARHVIPFTLGAFHLNKKPSLRFQNVQWQNGTLQRDRPSK